MKTSKKIRKELDNVLEDFQDNSDSLFESPISIDWSTVDIKREEWNPKLYTMVDVCEAGDLDSMTEASLGRVFQHYQNSGEKSFAIITSNRGVKPGLKQSEINKANQINNNNLAKLKSEVTGYGYFPVQGYGQEDLDDGTIGVVIEPSLFIIGITYKRSMELAKNYNQYGFIFSGPETGGKVWLALTDGSHQDLGNFNPITIAKYYSVVKGKKFAFESLPVSWVDGMICERMGKKEIPGITRVKKKEVIIK